MALATAVRQAIHNVDRDIAVSRIRPLSGYVEDSLARRRFALTLLAVFGGLAAFLTAAGIYGILSYSVSRRVREFGIRSAIGAAPRDLSSMILREAMAFTLPGLLAGLALSLAFGRGMKALVYQVSPVDPASLTMCAALLTGICLLSAWLPASRAARADPGISLRQE